MKAQLSRAVKVLIHFAVNVIGWTGIGRYLFNQIINTTMQRVHEVSHGGLTLKFATPNSLCDWRAKTFSTKEPETLEWIDLIPKDSILWDVGANIGLYSIYAAKRRNCKVYAFEPSVFNLELLARNIFTNGLTDQICIMPVALSDQLGTNQMHMTTTVWGGGTVNLQP